jgi:hypothetical protein
MRPQVHVEEEISMARNGTEAAPSDRDNQASIELDRDEITFGRQRPPPTTTLSRRRLRRLVEPGLLVAAIGVILLAVHATGGDGTPAAGGVDGRTMVTPSQPGRATEGAPSPRAQLRLVAPQTAVPGERLTVLAYRDRRLCGPTELRFDAKPTAQKLLRYADRPDPDYAEMFMAVDVPRSAKPGSHLIELYGPREGGPAGQLCGDVPEHQARLANATILVQSVRNRARAIPSVPRRC